METNALAHQVDADQQSPKHYGHFTENTNVQLQILIFLSNTYHILCYNYECLNLTIEVFCIETLFFRKT